MRFGTITLAALMGTAKPTPAFAPLDEAIRAFIPITFPYMSRSGPPELPGLMAASVCMTPANEKPRVPAGSERPDALIMPLVSVNSRPNGLPIAATSWPTSASALSPSRAAPIPFLGSVSLSTARSESESPPSNSALTTSPLWKVTVRRSAPSTTWKLVTMRPSSLQTKPDPSPSTNRSGRVWGPASGLVEKGKPLNVWESTRL